MLERRGWTRLSGAAPGSNLTRAISFRTDFFSHRFLFRADFFFRYVRCAAPLEAHVGTVPPRADLSRVSRFFYYSPPLLCAGAAGEKEPTCRRNVLSSTPHFIAIQVWRADESNSRVAFLLGRTCFFFHKVWRADEPTGFVAWAFAAGRLDIVEFNESTTLSHSTQARHGKQKRHTRNGRSNGAAVLIEDILGAEGRLPIQGQFC